MVDAREVHRRSLASFDAALQQELAAYRQAELAGDIDEMSRAATAMAGLRASAKELNLMAAEVVNPRPSPTPTNQYGLTAAESEHAKIAGISDEEYRRNKQRLYSLRAAGLYPQKGQA